MKLYYPPEYNVRIDLLERLRHGINQTTNETYKFTRYMYSKVQELSENLELQTELWQKFERDVFIEANRPLTHIELFAIHSLETLENPHTFHLLARKQTGHLVSNRLMSKRSFELISPANLHIPKLANVVFSDLISCAKSATRRIIVVEFVPRLEENAIHRLSQYRDISNAQVEWIKTIEVCVINKPISYRRYVKLPMKEKFFGSKRLMHLYGIMSTNPQVVNHIRKLYSMRETINGGVTFAVLEASETTSYVIIDNQMFEISNVLEEVDGNLVVIPAKVTSLPNKNPQVLVNIYELIHELNWRSFQNCLDTIELEGYLTEIERLIEQKDKTIFPRSIIDEIDSKIGWKNFLNNLGRF